VRKEAGYVGRKRKIHGTYRGVVADNRDPQNRGRLQLRVPEVFGESVEEWALPCAPYGGRLKGFYAVPAPGDEVWVAFEAGEPHQPIWLGGLWRDGEVPPDRSGQAATPGAKIHRSDRGLMLSLDDDERTIALSDADGDNIVTIEVQRGQVTIRASAKVVIDAPQIELVAGAGHPAVFGDDLFQYLNQAVSVFNTHMHPGETAGPVSVAPAPPAPPIQAPAAGMLSTAVRSG
jgi:uncharacterized protein involved in type VI secretion and phage assembly